MPDSIHMTVSLVTRWITLTWRTPAAVWLASPACSAASSSASSAGPAAVCLTLWDTEASAASFPGLRAGLAALPGETYEVIDADEGLAAGWTPTCARLLYFDGPRAPEQVAAADRAGRRRIWPTIRGLSGLVGIYVLLGRDLGSVVVTLATSTNTLDAAARAVMATDLAPDEDPALLPGPDRVEIHRVTAYQMPAAAPAKEGQI